MHLVRHRITSRVRAYRARPKILRSSIGLSLRCYRHRVTVPSAKNRQSKTVLVKGRIKTNNGNAVLSLLLEGAGIAALSNFLVLEEITAGRLVRLLPDHNMTSRTPVSTPYIRTCNCSRRRFAVSSIFPLPVSDCDCRHRAMLFCFMRARCCNMHLSVTFEDV